MNLGPFAVLLGSFASIWGQTTLSVFTEPMSLETLATRAGVRVIWSDEVGRLDSERARAAFTVLAIEDRARTNGQIRVLRIALSEPEQTRAVYIAEAKLRPLKDKLDGLVIGSAHWSGQNPVNTMISTVCPGEEGKLPLSFGYHYRYAEKPELSIGGPELPEFVFIGPTPLQLADIFEEAIEALRTH
jgi:hypothetical protein